MEILATKQIIFVIPYIRFSSITAQERWIIVETNDKVYFVQTESFINIIPPLPHYHFSLLAIFFFILKIIKNNNEKYRTDWNDYNLDTILSESIRYISIAKGNISNVSVKRNIFGGATLMIPTKTALTKSDGIKIKLNKQQLSKFLQIMQRGAALPITNDEPLINNVHNETKIFRKMKLFDLIFQLILIIFLVIALVLFFLYPDLFDKLNKI